MQMRHTRTPNRYRGLSGINAGPLDPNTMLKDLNDAFEDFKAKRDKEIADLHAGMDAQAKVLAAMKIGGGGSLMTPGDLPGRVSTDDAAALATFGRTGSMGFRAALSSDSDGKGGVVVFPSVSSMLQMRQFNQSALARRARRVTIESGDSFEEPWDLGDPGSVWVGERETRPETTNPDFVLNRVMLQEVYISQSITQRLLDDAAYPLGEWMAERIADKMGRASGEAFVTGDGVNKPRGITQYALSTAVDASRPWGTIQSVKTGVSGAFAAATTSVSPADVLVDTVYALRATYRQNASWLMNSKTAGACRKMKDADGRFIWTDSLVVGQPPIMLGYPVEIDEFIPDIGANAPAIWFGDWAQGYVIVDRPGVRLLRDPYTNKPNVIFYAYQRVGGGLQNSEAIKAVVFGT